MKLKTWAVLGSLLIVLMLALAVAVVTAPPVAQAAVSHAHASRHCTGKGLAAASTAPGSHHGRDYLVYARMGWAI
jgi:hypothetical protein